MSAGQPQTRDGPARVETHVTIPYLSRRGDAIEFAAAECDLTATGDAMTCRFRQVFVTLASLDATACVITTNGYEQTFRRQTATRWVSTEQPEGDCGLTEVTTLDDGGGTRWTMTVEKQATRHLERATCRAVAHDAAVYGWRDVKRRLPCLTIQPGAIER